MLRHFFGIVPNLVESSSALRFPETEVTQGLKRLRPQFDNWGRDSLSVDTTIGAAED